MKYKQKLQTVRTENTHLQGLGEQMMQYDRIKRWKRQTLEATVIQMIGWAMLAFGVVGTLAWHESNVDTAIACMMCAALSAFVIMGGVAHEKDADIK